MARQQSTITANDSKIADLFHQVENAHIGATELRRQLQQAQFERDAAQRAQDDMLADAARAPATPTPAPQLQSQRQLFSSTPVPTFPPTPAGMSDLEKEGWREAVRALRELVDNLEGELANAREASLYNVSGVTPRRELSARGGTDGETEHLRQQVSLMTHATTQKCFVQCLYFFDGCSSRHRHVVVKPYRCYALPIFAACKQILPHLCVCF